MLFSSLTFLWIFLPIVLWGNFILFKILGTTVSNFFLLLASLFFYAWGEPVYILLMLASILLNYLGGLIIGYLRFKKFSLFIIVSLNLLLLFVFKYANMIVDTELALPIGISFYTFQSLSYVIDVYRKDAKPQKNLFKLALYISFFPQLIAGPIVKYKDINKQINNRRISGEKFKDGIGRFIYGLSKKVILANTLAVFVDSVYDLEIANATPVMIWIASIFYTLQIYYDFSGYSDMAIGLGKMFGFEFKENFLYPYTSTSIKEFWRRWHISLSTWFKEYLYIPLGGNRKGNLRTAINLLIVFFLTGLWHGASYNFIIWGLYNGLFLLIERTKFSNFLNRFKPVAVIYTFLAVNTGWVFFRIEDINTAILYLRKMFLPFLYPENAENLLIYLKPYTIFIAFVSIISMGIIQRNLIGSTIYKKWKGSLLETIILTILLLFCFMTLASNTYNPFIYFRF